MVGVTSLIREMEHGIRECVAVRSRKNRPDVSCDTTVCRIVGNRLIVRCRNCGTDHAFAVRDGAIVLVESYVRTRALLESSPIR